MKPVIWLSVAACVALAAWSLAQTSSTNPHEDPDHGVLRVLTDPPTRGQCRQCHSTHGDQWGGGPFPLELFTDNTNAVAYWDQGAEPCHSERPDNYPLDEQDRLSPSSQDPGYFEANVGDVRRPGVRYRGRWPGELTFTNPAMSGTGRYVSPHAYDPDMPRRASGEGMCLNCHNPHGTPNPYDLLVAPYRGIAGHASVGPPDEYRLCFSCHSQEGPLGMEPENRRIEDFYDSGLNGQSAGHQIRMNPDIAISWPAHIQAGDMLPCYDCHNPHGSQGNDLVRPNGFLISDQRVGWSGLTDTIQDAAQCRDFCFGCHIPPDGIPGSKTVEGIVMNTIPDEDEHFSTATQNCYDFHGRDYSSSTGFNVHNPNPDPDGKAESGRSIWDQW